MAYGHWYYKRLTVIKKRKTNKLQIPLQTLTPAKPLFQFLTALREKTVSLL